MKLFEGVVQLQLWLQLCTAATAINLSHTWGGGKRSSGETTYNFYGCCPAGCHTLVAAQRIIFSRFLVTGPHHELTASAGDTGKKKTTSWWTTCVLNPYEWCCLIHFYAFTRNLGVAPLMLWTPLILRRYLTIVCFWPWFSSLSVTLWLQLQLVA